MGQVLIEVLGMAVASTLESVKVLIPIRGARVAPISDNTLVDEPEMSPQNRSAAAITFAFTCVVN